MINTPFRCSVGAAPVQTTCREGSPRSAGANIHHEWHDNIRLTHNRRNQSCRSHRARAVGWMTTGCGRTEEVWRVESNLVKCALRYREFVRTAVGPWGGRGGSHCWLLIRNETEAKQAPIMPPSIKTHLEREIISLLSRLVSSCNSKYITGIISNRSPPTNPPFAIFFLVREQGGKN